MLCITEPSEFTDPILDQVVLMLATGTLYVSYDPRSRTFEKAPSTAGMTFSSLIRSANGNVV